MCRVSLMTSPVTSQSVIDRGGWLAGIVLKVPGRREYSPTLGIDYPTRFRFLKQNGNCFKKNEKNKKQKKKKKVKDHIANGRWS